jgi:sugar (pentulose or hexulose) kinase
VVTDDDLAPLGSAAIAYEPDYPRPGWAEQHPRLWEAALGPAIDGALRAAALAPGAVGALGIAGSDLDGPAR